MARYDDRLGTRLSLAAFDTGGVIKVAYWPPMSRPALDPKSHASLPLSTPLF